MGSGGVLCLGGIVGGGGDLLEALQGAADDQGSSLHVHVQHAAGAQHLPLSMVADVPYHGLGNVDACSTKRARHLLCHFPICGK